MAFIERIIEALRNDDDNLDMTIEDIRTATVQEVLLYYTYCTIVDKKWCPDFIRVPKTVTDGRITFTSDHDILAVVYCIIQSSWLVSGVSCKTENKIVKYSELYQIQFDKKIRRLFKKLTIIFDNDDISSSRKRLIYHIHDNTTKSARNV